MAYSRRSRRRPKFSRRMHANIPCWMENCSGMATLIKGCSSKVLLADHEGELHEVRTTVQTMPTARRLSSCTPGGVAIDPEPVSFPHMGNWHPGPISPSSSADEVPGGGHWVLHQVDRGRAWRTDKQPTRFNTLCGRTSFAVLESQSIWCLTMALVCKSATRQAMHGAWRQASVRLGRAPSD